MADRRNLKDRATSAGKSVAGTLKQGVQKLKRKAQTIAKDDETGIEISEVQGQYLVIDSDGSAIGPYDDKMKAASKARELKQEKQQATQGAQSGSARMDDETGQDQGRVQKAATRFSQGVNKRLGVTQGEDTGESRGVKERFDDFATSFAQGVNDTGSDTDDDESTSPTLPMMGGGERDGDEQPTLAFMGDPDNDGDPELAFFGDVDGDGETDMTLFEPNQGQEPTFPGFGDDGGDGPSIPGFGPADQDADDVTMPDMMGSGPNPEMLPFATSEERDDENTDPFGFM